MLMDGIHDLDDAPGFRSSGSFADEICFHHRWETVTRALLVVVAAAVRAGSGVRPAALV